MKNVKEKFQDKVRGALIGGAVGDALGYPVEFIGSFYSIAYKYGEGGIRDYEFSIPSFDTSSKEALISDDTQMTLYTAEGLLEALKRGESFVGTIRDAYLAWYGGQERKQVEISYSSRLSEIPELNRHRAPGTTCLSALASIFRGNEPCNDSKGCGGIMRVSPIGIFGAVRKREKEETARLAGEVAEVTHLHPLSTYSSAAMAVLIQLCLSDADVPTLDSFKEKLAESMLTVETVYGSDAPFMGEFKSIVKKAGILSELSLTDWELIEEYLGGGWVAEETFAIALFSVLRHFNDVDGCLRCAVNHGGDSDSTGAVAGNIIGAVHGYEAIPKKFKVKLQFHDLLLSFADALVESNK